MQNWGFSKTALRLTAIVGVLAGMLTIFGCGGGEEAAVKVAAADTVISTPTALKQTLPAIEGTTFALPAGAFTGTTAATALGSQATTVKFTGTTTATPTTTITDASGRTASGPTTFGSCIITITASTIPGLPVTTPPTAITLNPCAITIKTAGVTANNAPQSTTITLTVGTTVSQSLISSVSIDSVTGAVTLGSTPTGQSVTLVITTGGAGG